MSVSDTEWRYATCTVESFQRRLTKAIKAAQKKGATKLHVHYRRFRLIATGPETDAQFEQRKAGAMEERTAILKARKKVKELTKQERTELATTRKLLMEATKNLTVNEFDQLVSDLLRNLED